jgi:hypothetical protein
MLIQELVFIPEIICVEREEGTENREEGIKVY